MKLPVGISDFEKLIEEEYLFADKSLLIKDIMEDGGDVILITRPRRFGKTLNLSMLYYFLRKNHSQAHNLFRGLKISEEREFCDAHQQQYPVIFVSFKDVKEASYVEAYSEIVKLIRRLYSEHRYLLEGDLLFPDEKERFMAFLTEKADKSDIKGAIKQLSEHMQKKFNKAPIILIDEYDTPIQEAYLHNYYEKMIRLMRSILGKALKDNKTLGKAVLTGITRIAQESLFSGVNNLSVYTLLREKYGQYFGFTEDEVLKLHTESKQTVPIASIKEWYNGYQIGKNVLYNPWSIISCFDNSGELKPYWVHTSSNDLITQLLSTAKPMVKQQFEELLQGKTIEQPIFENLVFLDLPTREEALWSLLLYAGYLKVISSTLQGYQLIASITIPNKEVSFVYDKVVAGWFGETISMASYNEFVQSLRDRDMDKFKSYLSSYIMQSGSYFDFKKNKSEQVFHVFILGLVVGLRDYYVINSNQESGLGRFDVTFIPKDKQKPGIVLEFKMSPNAKDSLKKAHEALDQIKDNHYIEVFKQHEITSVLAIGLAFFGKQVELAHENIPIAEVNR